MRNYSLCSDGATARVAAGEEGRLRPVCPSRFHEDSLISRWVGHVLLDTDDPIAISEVGFLTGATQEDGEEGGDVGRIDLVLFRQGSMPLEWCALEIQAVYITGRSIHADFASLREHLGAGLPFPPVHHRLDYRSSGPKRLMPQL